MFPCEPLARLAASRLVEAGIPCLVRSEGVGPGAWGSAANLPYSILVPEGEQWRAREVLGLPPAEVLERCSPPSGTRPPLGVRIALVVLALMLLLVLGAGVGMRLLQGG